MHLPDFISVHPYWLSVLLSTLACFLGFACFGLALTFIMQDGNREDDKILSSASPDPAGILLGSLFMLLLFAAFGVVASLVMAIILGPAFWLYSHFHWSYYAALLIGIPIGLLCAFGGVLILDAYGSRKSAANPEPQD